MKDSQGDKGSEITQDQLDRFERGEMKLEDFSEGQRAALEKILSGEVAEVEAPPAGTGVKEDGAPAAAVADEKKDEVPKDYVPGAKYKEKADEANTYKQKADAAAKRLKEIEAELELVRAQSAVQVEAPVKDPNKLWSDDHQLDVATRLARIEAQQMQGVKGAQEKLEALKKEIDEQKKFAEVNAFAFEFPELRLSRPFEEANAEYVAFTKKLGATPDDLRVVDRYFEDPAFRKEMESKGIKAPRDYDRLSIILQAYHAKNESGYPTYRAAYLDKVLSSAELEKRFNGQYLKGVEDAVTKIANNKNETTILDSSRTNEGGIGMSEQQMEAWLVAHPRPVTPGDKAIMAQIQTYLEARAAGG